MRVARATHFSFFATNITRDNIIFDLNNVFFEGNAVRFNPCAVAVQTKDHSWRLLPKLSCHNDRDPRWTQCIRRVKQKRTFLSRILATTHPGSSLSSNDELLDVERRPRLHLYFMLVMCSVSVSTVLPMLNRWRMFELANDGFRLC